ncbi:MULTISPECIES: argininosuccinate synthase [unclassified Curtobacterium]|uniref:argininosuccinate synthase n=1 Tax=unclassified Curtobacterium TaxID=257496 RepID=UPI0008DC63BB|nr:MULTISPECIES: argininosuccinate synthase [unclassified Curtobacterium]OIH97398.1 argininosuccinate synthase [Curtobacterium sp. MCBA15_003]OII29398.1 argininosuccinate synthase [Curtobacterium sp. MMLR14_006]
MADRVVLAYSGDLGTSVGVGWLRDTTGKDVVALAVDVGQGGEDLDAVRARALECGAVESIVVDARDEFADEYVVPALKANALSLRRSSLVAALSRPLVAKHLALTATQLGADTVAHGCSGTGDDPVRFEAAVAAIAPDLRCVAPVRDLALTPDSTVAYAAEHRLPVPGSERAYSVDQNLWGRAVETGFLEDPWSAPDEDLYACTQDPATPREPDEVTVTFERGVPVAIDGQRFSVLRVVQELNAVAGKHGVGRLDVVEDRLVGIKTRQIAEAPGATALIAAHEDLERLTLERDVIRYKRGVESEWADLVSDGLWFGSLKRSLDAFVDHTQQHVSGDVRLRLHGGLVTVTGRRSEQSLYDFDLASDGDDAFDHSLSKGFSELWSLPSRIAARRDRAN